MLKILSSFHPKIIQFFSIFCFINIVPAVSDDRSSSSFHEISKAGVFTIGYRENARPLSFLTSGTSEPTGYTIDLCNKLFSKTQEQIKQRYNKIITKRYVRVTAEDRFRKLADNSIDVLCGITSKTLTREKNFEFSIPIFVTGGVFLSRSESRINNIADLYGKNIAIINNTTTKEALTTLIQRSGIYIKNIVEVNNISEGIALVSAASNQIDRIDAFATDQAPLLALINNQQNTDELYVSKNFFSFELYALAFNKNRRDLRLVADGILSQLYRSGEVNFLVDHWFGALGGRVPERLREFFALNAVPE